MQAVKDTFYMSLRERLAQVNPSRTLPGSERPAVVVGENENQDGPLPDTFCVNWLGEGTVAADALAAGWRSLRCEIVYRTAGSEPACGEDRGRVLAQLDDELREILSPRSAELRDYTLDPAQNLGSAILWTAAKFQDAKEANRVLQRTVSLEIIWQEEA